MRSFLAGGLFALSSVFGASAATFNSSAHLDSATGIDFQRWCEEKSGFCFGVALPEEVDTDFVGQMVVPLSESKGWGGVSLGGGMTSVLLVAAWPDGDSVVSSLRKTSTYVNPDEYSGDASLVEIPDGTSVNSTHLTYTFLCSGCIIGSPTTFSASDDTYFLGWALSKTNPTTPGSSSSVLPYHAAGYGSFEMLLGQAKSSKYSTWADMAQSTPTTTASPSVSASPSTSATPTPSVPPTVSNTTYDYIVVGGGPAGIITAERLAEADKKVLLIERGAAPLTSMGASDSLPWNNSLTPFDVPALGASLSKLGVIGDYLCEDVPGMAGCVLGGGTIVNAMAFIYPQAADFDDKWPTGWKWDDVSSAADRLYERNPGSVLPSADGKRYDQAMYNVLSSFFNGLGWKSVNQQEQPNEKHLAYSHPSWSIADGIRAGPVRSYLPLVEDRDNFSLHLHTMVRRLVRRGGRVTGVEVQNANGGIEIINVRAGGKVILAAGSMSTPRILFNSGIGPDEQIKSVQSGSTGITLPPQAEWINLPVGHNLKDHPMFTVTVNTNSNFTGYNTSSVMSTPAARDRRLFAQGSGVLTQGGHRLQFWTSNVGSDGVTRFFQGSCSPSGDADITMKLYLTHGATSSGVLGINAAGSTILESDPWLQTQADKDAVTSFIEGFISDLTGSDAGFSLSGVTTADDIVSDMTSGDHWVGTAKMGTDDGRNNGSSVVDTNTKVYGTENLYIVDASIHPDLPTGNTQAIVMVAAEAAVARILAVKDTLPSSSIAIPSSTSAVVSSSAVATSSVVASSASSAAVPPAVTDPVSSLPGGSVSGPSVTVVTTTATVMVTSTTTFTVLPTFS